MTTEYGIDTTKLATHIAKHAIDRFLEFAEAKVKERWAQHKNKNTALFDQYIKSQSKNCAKIRTLVYDKQSAYLPDIYVPLRARMYLQTGGKHHTKTQRRKT